MVTFDLGSVRTEVSKLIEDIPSFLSGTNMLNLIDQERQYAACYLNTTIGSKSIGETYQPAIISLSAASLLRSMDLVGADVATVKLGDF